MKSLSFLFSALLLIATPVLGAETKPIVKKTTVNRKPDAVREVLSCSPESVTDKNHKVVVFEKSTSGGTSFHFLETVSSEKRIETRIRSLSVVPIESYTEADAWTGSVRFLKSVTLGGEGIQLVVGTAYDGIREAYRSTLLGKVYFCTVNGSFNEVLSAIKPTLNN